MLNVGYVITQMHLKITSSFSDALDHEIIAKWFILSYWENELKIVVMMAIDQ